MNPNLQQILNKFIGKNREYGQYDLLVVIEQIKSENRVKDELRAKVPELAKQLQEQSLVQTDKLCYNCGNKTFLFDGAYRCIYDGSYSKEGL